MWFRSRLKYTQETIERQILIKKQLERRISNLQQDLDEIFEVEGIEEIDEAMGNKK
jgi:hypothetical protein